MSRRDRRRHPRIAYPGPIRISWEDARGQVKFAYARCVDISESGMRIETREPIVIRGYVTMKAERIELSNIASVRHCSRCGSKYLIGLEFGGGFRSLVSELEPAVRSEVGVA